MATVQHKTPGVYISEPDSFPPAIVGVETAVPAFIGYTGRRRTRAEFEMVPRGYFGSPISREVRTILSKLYLLPGGKKAPDGDE